VSPEGLSALAGLRVVELGVWVAAPSAAALLADWGADVIKVEAPAGDPMRQVFGSLGIDSDMPNPAFSLDNRGKRSMVLNLRQPEGQAHLEDLLATADVFLSNLRPDALDGLGLEPAATVARHPRLVYCSISGYGLEGAERNRPTYDIGAFWARSGLSMQMADHEGTPLNARGGIGDHITGLAALGGVLAAILEQRATGRGQVVEVSLLRTGTYVLGWDLGLQMTLGKVARAEPRDRNQAPLMNPYRAADGRWFFFTGLEAARLSALSAGPWDVRSWPTTHASPTPRRSGGTGPRSSPSSTPSSPSSRSILGPSGSTKRASGGRPPRPRPKWCRTPKSWPTMAWWRSTAGRPASCSDR
jgi:crotonobetainyl-CoA:carnitine CoA-transferase CaiB-like acyl-CoA transferase